MNYTPKGNDNRLAYDTDQLREKTGFGKTKLFDEIAAGRLKARRLGRKLVFLHDDVVAWLDGLPEREIGKLRKPKRPADKVREAA